MNDQTLQAMITFIASILGGIYFGYWQVSFSAGMFFFFLMICIDGILNAKK